MKKLFILLSMLGYSFFSNSLFSSGGVSPQNPIDPYCGFDIRVFECRMVTEGSVCVADDDCKELVVTPEKPGEPEEPIEP